jgi:hypothetical protein
MNLNIRELAEGTKVLLAGGRTGEVVSNPRDGIWILVREIPSSTNPSPGGTEEMVFVDDVLEDLGKP